MAKDLLKVKKKLLTLFDNLLKTIFNKTDDESNSSTKNETVNKNNSNTKNKTVNESKNDNDNDNNNDNDNYSDNESDYESDNKNKKDGYYYRIKQLNNWFKKIDQTASLEDQIKILKTKKFLDEYWRVSCYSDNKELNYKLFEAKAAYILNDLDEHLFKKIFDCKFATLAEKLINTVDKKRRKSNNY